MQLPVQITFRNISRSREVEFRILSKVSDLEIYYPRIMGCRVVIDRPHRRHRDGNPYVIKIDITVPGKEISVNRQPSIYKERKDFHDTRISKSEEINLEQKQMEAAINEAFNAARRMLQDHIRKQRGAIKTHEEIPHATVTKLFRRKGYGLLKTANGRQLLFEKQNVLNSDYQNLKIGTKVTYLEEETGKGPEATLIRIVGSLKTKFSKAATTK
ncbi:MAG TPA: HPF/RaiA family ribosome-associated protein [Acidobacteriota bacterium]|nr:HPF/RaiA family ribosome-associated protein [Acidobacteriota bacterium]